MQQGVITLLASQVVGQRPDLSHRARVAQFEALYQEQVRMAYCERDAGEAMKLADEARATFFRNMNRSAEEYLSSFKV